MSRTKEAHPTAQRRKGDTGMTETEKSILHLVKQADDVKQMAALELLRAMATGATFAEAAAAANAILIEHGRRPVPIVDERPISNIQQLRQEQEAAV